MNKILIVAILMTFYVHQSFSQNRFTLIAGYVTQIESGDSVTVFTNQYGYVISEPLMKEKRYTARISNHHFQFKIPASNTPIFMELRFNNKRNIPPLIGYFMEQGDDINIRVDTSGYKFSGTGQRKYEVCYNLNKIKNNDLKGIGEDLLSPSGLGQVQNKTEVTTRHQLDYLNTQKTLLNPDVFELLMAHIYGFNQSEVSTTYYHHFLNLDNSSRNMALNSIREQTPSKLPDPGEVFKSNPILKYSGEYTGSIILKYQLDSCYLLNKPFVLQDCYQFIKSHYKGVLRERILTNLFFYYKSAGQDISAPLIDAISFIREPDFLNLLKEIQSAHATGAQAFDFRLPDVNGLRHSLSEYKGKIVVIDFWYTGCGNCIRIAPFLLRAEHEFEKLPVIFLSINVDKNKELWIEGIKSGKYNSPYVENLFTEGLGLKHALCTHYQVHGCPTLLLIDKNGKLMKSPFDPRDDDGKDLFQSIRRELVN